MISKIINNNDIEYKPMYEDIDQDRNYNSNYLSMTNQVKNTFMENVYKNYREICVNFVIITI